MNFFAGLSSPFSMASQFEALSGQANKDDDFSPASSGSESSDFEAHYSNTSTTPVQAAYPIASTSAHSSAPSSPRTPTRPPAAHPQQQPTPASGPACAEPTVPLSPLQPPPNSFADAQAAMAAQNSSHSQNLIGHFIDNTLPGAAPSQLEFLSILGLGAYGVVYLARDVLARPTAWPTSRAHPELGHQPLYAVKCLNKVGLDQRQRNFQRREINLHARASQHPNVVSLYNVIDEPNCIYVVLEFCEEGDLFGMITERQRYLGDDELIRSVFLQILDSVQYCHDQKIYHRDLKPENILCSDDGRKVVLADFGLATSEPTSGDFGCGSTFYMSPECQGGLFQRLASYSTAQNDVWSLGVILVNLTCGRNPWKQACPSDETFCAYLGNPDFLRSILPISDHTNRILKRVFALNPQARISLADLRNEILAVSTFVMTDDELRGATRATKEAARAFRSGHHGDVADEFPAAQEEGCVQYDGHDEPIDEDAFPLSSPQASPWTSTFQDEQDQEQEQDHPAVRPLTPPATPANRKGARPAPLDVLELYSSVEAVSDEDEPMGQPSIRRRLSKEVFSTPVHSDPAPARDSIEYPPSPVTPTRASPGSSPATSASTKAPPRPRSPRSRAPRASPTPAQRERRRKASLDSSSSSSGASSSQPPTPTYATHAAAQHPNVHIVSAGEQLAHATGDEFMDCDGAGPKSFTAYYPLFAEFADVRTEQEKIYQAEEGVQFPMPPVSGRQ